MKGDQPIAFQATFVISIQLDARTAVEVILLNDTGFAKELLDFCYFCIKR